MSASVAHARSPLQQAVVPVAAGSASTTSIETRGMRVSDVRFERGTIPSHYHERACLSVILEGGFSEFFSTRVVDATVGWAFSKPPGERHRDVLHGSRQIVLEPANADALPFSEHSPHSLFDEITTVQSAVVNAIAWRIAREVRTADAHTPLSVEGLTLELLAAMGRRLEPTAFRRELPRWLKLVHDRLVSDPVPPRIDELALLANVHPVYLARVFRRHFGSSIGAYARRLRLDWAAQQLSTTSTPLSRISMRAGFADQSHFTRAFRQYSALTPRQYRLATRS